MNNDKASPVALEQVVADLAHELYAMAQGPQPIEDAVAAIAKRLASFEAAPVAPLLMQDENSGRDGRRYNEWHASRPDARLNAREAAAAMEVQGADWWYDLASRHATADWNCDQPDGYLNAVKALVEDALASTAATPTAPSAVTDEQIDSAFYGWCPYDGKQRTDREIFAAGYRAALLAIFNAFMPRWTALAASPSCEQSAAHAEAETLDVCTDADNCTRCKTARKFRGDTEHAGIPVGNSFGAKGAAS